MSRKNYPYGVPVFPAPAGASPFGEVRYVAASGGDDGNYGKHGSRPLATIAKAISLSAAGDTVVLGPGTHSVDVSVAALIPKADMQFIAAVPPMGGMPSTVITHDADDGATLVSVDVDGVGFHGVKFLMVAGGTTATTLVAASQTTAVNGLVFNDCWFDHNSVDHATVDNMGIKVDDATNATTGLVVRNCRFRGGDATTTVSLYINVGVGGIPDGLIEGCIFALEAAGGDAVGVNFLDPAAVTSYAFVIRNNDFIGSDDGASDSEGIVIASASTDAEIIGMMRSNYFAYASANPITKDQGSASQLMNFRADGAGGSIFDPLT
jgi:hypothetical protein